MCAMIGGTPTSFWCPCQTQCTASAVRCEHAYRIRWNPIRQIVCSGRRKATGGPRFPDSRWLAPSEPKFWCRRRDLWYWIKRWLVQHGNYGDDERYARAAKGTISHWCLLSMQPFFAVLFGQLVRLPCTNYINYEWFKDMLHLNQYLLSNLSRSRLWRHIHRY